MNNLEDITVKAELFGHEVREYLDELGILDEVRNLETDHVGLRLRKAEDVTTLKNQLDTEGKLISSAVVNGREICIFELQEPLLIGNWTIPCIELPFPKTDHPYEDGLEHIEFVIPSSAETLDEMRGEFKRAFPNVNIESLTEKNQYFESLPTVESEQLPNPTIELRKRIGLTIKFHPNSIKNVVEMRGVGSVK